jgi:hypothetical protein
VAYLEELGANILINSVAKGLKSFVISCLTKLIISDDL